jgi:hypothetical protein
MSLHRDRMCWGKKEVNCSWSFSMKGGDSLPHKTSQKMQGWGEKKKRTSMNDCRKRKEIADMETVLKAPMNSTMLINSYEVVSYAVWFVKMKDCTASFKEAKIFHVSNVTLNSQDSKFRVGRFQVIGWHHLFPYTYKLTSFNRPFHSLLLLLSLSNSVCVFIYMNMNLSSVLFPYSPFDCSLLIA